VAVEANPEISELRFLQHLTQNAPQMMWLLGAGTSRSAGMPTATDIIWDLKRRYFCLKENQDIRSHDLNNSTIKHKIQNYLNSQGFPVLWSAEEYSFYFELTFGEDYAAQQRYLNEVLAPEKISLSIGHRALAALLSSGHARIVFTTNFDAVIETAYSHVTNKSLSAFHLEGSYAALDALNSERFPLYAKIHGDFRYRSIKNLPNDLLINDHKIQKCFLAASDRYGLVVTGYSGRDANVMAMLKAACEQNNPFPGGLFWTVPQFSSVSDTVRAFISEAQAKGVRAHLVETGTFDIMLSKIWRQIPDKPTELELKVRTSVARPVFVPLPPPGDQYPILRTNALPVTNLPRQCAQVDYRAPFTFSDLNARLREHKPEAIFSYTDRILFWGKADSASQILDKDLINGISEHAFDDPIMTIKESSFIKSFFENAMAQALCQNRPLRLNRRNKTYYAVVDHRQADSPILQPIKDALSSPNNPGHITGSVRGLRDAHWAEALSLQLEVRNGLPLLLVRPDVWISPLSMREHGTDFLRSRKLRRYNHQSYHLLDAWITVLFGSVGQGQDAQISCFPDSDYPANFSISTRTAFSRRRGGHA
jgi:hypothetical protein